MTAAFNKFNQFVQDLANKVHNLGADALYVGLANTAPVATNTVWANITEISAGNGYTAGGDAGSAAAFYRRQDGVNQYIAVTNSGGTPSANTRIGDYVDAELIRGGEWGNIGDGVILGEALSATWI